MLLEDRRKIIMGRPYEWGDTIDSVSKRQITALPSATETTPATNTGESCGSEPQTTIRQAREVQILVNDSDIGDPTSSSGSVHPIKMVSTKGWSIEDLVSQSSYFHHVTRVSATSHTLQDDILEYEKKGIPLVIEGYDRSPQWPEKLFTPDSFSKHAESDQITVRNVHTWTDKTIQLSEFLETCRSISPYAEENETERSYGKDTECPKPWEDWLTKGVTPSLLAGGSHDLFKYLPESASVQTLMCYLGVGDTFTPCHKDLCASSGQNLMCYTENDGKSFWFMTEGGSAGKAARYFQDIGQELDHENHVVTLEELAKAPFKIYIVEQKLGDLVLVPPRSCHQVVNSGGMTIKTSWSRMTMKGLVTAYHHELPIYRRVCRPEIYRVKTTVYHVLIAQTTKLEEFLSGNSNSFDSSSKCNRRSTRTSSNHTEINALVRGLKELLPLYDCILGAEHDPDHFKMGRLTSERSKYNDPITCDFCGGDIFQSFFECLECTEGDSSSENRLHLCPGCYVEGRSCKCSLMKPMQYRNFKELLKVRHKAAKALRRYEEQRGQTYTLKLNLEDSVVPALFRAACTLHRIRESAKKEYSKCGRHGCPSHQALYCKGCHRGTCYLHTINMYKIHSVDALLTHSDPSEHGDYHIYHLGGKNRYEEDQDFLKLEQELGTPSLGYSQLVFNALHFVHCKPINPRFMEAGWYDKEYHILEDDGKPLAHLALVDGTESLQLTTNCPSSDDRMMVDIVTAPKSKSTMYVDVPPALYSIDCALSEYKRRSSVQILVKETNTMELSGSISQSPTPIHSRPVTEANLPSPSTRVSSPLSDSIRPGERDSQSKSGSRASSMRGNSKVQVASGVIRFPTPPSKFEKAIANAPIPAVPNPSQVPDESSAWTSSSVAFPDVSISPSYNYPGVLEENLSRASPSSTLVNSLPTSPKYFRALDESPFYASPSTKFAVAPISETTADVIISDVLYEKTTSQNPSSFTPYPPYSTAAWQEIMDGLIKNFPPYVLAKMGTILLQASQMQGQLTRHTSSPPQQGPYSPGQELRSLPHYPPVQNHYQTYGHRYTSDCFKYEHASSSGRNHQQDVPRTYEPHRRTQSHHIAHGHNQTQGGLPSFLSPVNLKDEGSDMRNGEYNTKYRLEVPAPRYPFHMNKKSQDPRGEYIHIQTESRRRQKRLEHQRRRAPYNKPPPVQRGQEPHRRHHYTAGSQSTNNISAANSMHQPNLERLSWDRDQPMTSTHHVPGHNRWPGGRDTVHLQSNNSQLTEDGDSSATSNIYLDTYGDLRSPNDSEMIVDDETFPEPEQMPAPDCLDANGIEEQLFEPRSEDVHVNDVQIPAIEGSLAEPTTAGDSETRLDAQNEWVQWEDDYEKMDDPLPLTRQTFRVPNKDEDGTRLDNKQKSAKVADQDLDLLNVNPWI